MRKINEFTCELATLLYQLDYDVLLRVRSIWMEELSKTDVSLLIKDYAATLIDTVIATYDSKALSQCLEGRA